MKGSEVLSNKHEEVRKDLTNFFNVQQNKINETIDAINSKYDCEPIGMAEKLSLTLMNEHLTDFEVKLLNLKNETINELEKKIIAYKITRPSLLENEYN